MKLHTILKIAKALAICSFSTLTYAADIPLYPTGPSQDSAFVRFINGTDRNLTLAAGGSKSKIALDLSQPISQYYSVASKGSITGEFVGGKLSSSISLNIRPSEFASVVALSSDTGLKQVIIKEQPKDFNGLKSSLALYNLGPHGCGQAGLVVVDRAIAIFEKVQSDTVQRRLLNPITLSVQLTCNGKLKGNVLNLGSLEAGERYSIFAVPDLQGVRIFHSTDAIAR
jgi:hypothetical protein